MSMLQQPFIQTISCIPQLGNNTDNRELYCFRKVPRSPLLVAILILSTFVIIITNITIFNPDRLVSAQTTPGTPIEEEWVDPDYGKKTGHAIFNKVIIECPDNVDNNCVNGILTGRGITTIHLYATPLRSGNICCIEPPDYNIDIVQNCLADPNNAENCDWGKITPTSYSTLPTGERSVVAKRDFPKDPQDIGESFISVVLTYDGATLKGRVIYQACSSNTCVGTSDEFKPLQLTKRTPSHHASSVSVFSQLVNDDGGKASFTNGDFAIFWTQIVCQQGTTDCRTITPSQPELIQSSNSSGLNRIDLNFDTTTYDIIAVCSRPATNSSECKSAENSTKILNYDVTYSNDCNVKNVELDKNYECDIVINDKPPFSTVKDSVITSQISPSIKEDLLKILGDPSNSNDNTIPVNQIACARLSAFLNLVNALKITGKIANSDAALFIELAQSAKKSIGCNTGLCSSSTYFKRPKAGY